MNKHIAVVTGANRGIGFEIVRQLAKKGWIVVLTARDEAKGRAACEQLKKQGLDVEFRVLDVANPESIHRLKNDLEKTFGRLDVLVNNAGIFIDRTKNSLNVDMKTVRETMETNFFGPLQLSQTLLSLLLKSDDARIINISSGLGQLSDGGGGYPSYSISKAALNMMTVQMAEDLKGRVHVNSVCPGWVRTEMGGPGATRSVEEGTDTAVWLATEPNVPNGKFIRDRKEIAW
ncbi:MAG TPA: SDR family oxidoreductase [Nitrospiria bacterium]|jgi:NAD(P)-dependent dehydrogenase (short-subunit alcohol dehydrogenase family)|nr:SDR family oxidoreductase [Nitrospiria bacterium]